jgi:hypothetical protein
MIFKKYIKFSTIPLMGTYQKAKYLQNLPKELFQMPSFYLFIFSIIFEYLFIWCIFSERLHYIFEILAQFCILLEQILYPYLVIDHESHDFFYSVFLVVVLIFVVCFLVSFNWSDISSNQKWVLLLLKVRFLIEFSDFRIWAGKPRKENGA